MASQPGPQPIAFIFRPRASINQPNLPFLCTVPGPALPPNSSLFLYLHGRPAQPLTTPSNFQEPNPSLPLARPDLAIPAVVTPFEEVVPSAPLAKTSYFEATLSGKP